MEGISEYFDIHNNMLKIKTTFEPPEHFNNMYEINDRMYQNINALKQYIEKIKGRSIITFFFNKSHIEFFELWVSMCDKNNIDNVRGSTIVFPLDKESHESVIKNGFMSFYDTSFYGNIYNGQSNVYGDGFYAKLMYMKNLIIDILLKNSDKDVLFQDIDLVWIRNPMPHLEDNLQDNDILFMIDPNRRFYPHYVCSGFMYIKNNNMNKSMFDYLRRHHEFTASYRSHQEAMNVVMHYMSDKYGYKLSQLDTVIFVGGENFKGIDKNKTHVMHYNWTRNKGDKFTKIEFMNKMLEQ